jgi:hypothetical protein
MRSAYGAAVTIALAAVFACSALAAQSAPPPTLTGEQLVASFPATAPAVQAQCNPDGSSTLTLTTGGVATGPYPGTWTGTILVLIGPQHGAPSATGFLTGPVVSWQESFRVDSPNGVVTGTKTLSANAGNLGVCREFHGEQPPDSPLFGVNLNGYFYEANAAALSYEATIDPPGKGSYHDEGTATGSLSNSHVTCCPNEAGQDLDVKFSSGSFQEQFQSTLSTTVKSKPGRGCGDKNHAHERRDECKDE